MEEVPPSEDNEVVVYISISDEDSTNTRSCKRDRQTDSVLQQYEFMQDDVIDLVSSYDEEADKNFIEEDNIDARNLMLEHGLVNDEAEDLRVAFAILATGDWEAFLATPVINNKFKPAFSLLEFFGIGKGTKNVKHLWRLLWEEKLIINSSQSMYSGKCVACVHERSLGYVISERRIVGGVGKIVPVGLMGPLCYDIRFSTLRNLVDHCLILTLSLKDADFDHLVEACLEQDLSDIIYANENMDDAYDHLKQ